MTKHVKTALAVAALLLVQLIGCQTETQRDRTGQWELYVCAGISSMGCGTSRGSWYPDETSCYRALEQLADQGQPAAESKSRRDIVAYCRPWELNYE